MAPNTRSHISILRLSTLALALTPALLALAPNAQAQKPAAAPATGDDNQTLYIGAVSGDDVYVRSGSGESYYPFYKVHRGDLVKITGDKYGFARVAIAGPAFKDAFGYIKHAKADNTRVRLAADGHSGVTLGRVDVIAPNLDASNQPKDSWKVLVRLDADKPLTVLEATDTGTEMIYKVALPAEATGWVNAQFVPHATAEESEMFLNMLAGKTTTPPAAAAAPPTTPNQPAANTVANNTKPTTAQPPADPNAPPTAPAGDGQMVAETPPVPGSDIVAIAPTPAATQPEKPHAPTFADLESAFKRLQTEPKDTAELAPMRAMYAALAEREPNDKNIQAYTATRIKQLDIWEAVQQKKIEITGVQQRIKMSGEEAEAVRLALERSAEYTAVGRVAASTIYDGASLPKLYRLQDPATGRTIAYLKPDTDYALANRIDIIIGIVGDKTYDESMRLNIITPRRIDVLSPEGKPGATVAGAKTDTEDK